MNPAEFNNYSAVSTHEKDDIEIATEPGKPNRQYLAAVVGKAK